MEGKTYTFYYLPNAVRAGYVNSKGDPQIGKVGMTTKPAIVRVFENAREFDISGWIELGKFIGSRKDAIKIEKEYQIKYDCVDNSAQPTVKLKSEFTNPTLVPCQYCSRKISKLNKNKHERACKSNPNQVISRREVKKVKCTICLNEFNANNFNRHTVSCKKRNL
jgi:hypothetical protein